MNKKITLLVLAVISSVFAFAQSPYPLSGTSYLQNFDNLSGGLPTGWRVDTFVNPNAGLGNNAINRFSATAVNWTSTSRGFKNVASADGLVATSTNTDQNSSTDRALGIRQVSATGWDDHDTLTSVSFNIANTAGLSGFNLQFKLMSLNTTAKRYNNWIVQYGLGANPTTFTTVTTVPSTILIDSNFNTINVSANFGTALNNSSVPVWIRICAQDSTMGSGNRPLVGLDDFNLTWTGTAVNNTPQVVSYSPAPGTTNVPVSTTSLSITFDKTMTIGTGNVTVKNLTDATQQVIAAGSCTASSMTVTIPGVTLITGKSYAVQYDSTCFKWTTYSCLGVYDNTSWTFSTPPAILPPVTSLNETFTNCTNSLMGSFKQQSTVGTQTWRCSSFGHTDSFSVYMNGGTATESFDNEDWLLSPALNLSAMTNPYLHFWTKRRFSGTNTKEVFVSSDYTNDVATATWGNAIIANMSTLDSNNWNNIKNTNLTAFKATPFTIGFKYMSTANNPSIAEEWTIDDVSITEGPLNVSSIRLEELDIYVASNQQGDDAQLIILSDKTDKLQCTMRDVFGHVIMSNNLDVRTGKNTFTLPTSGLASSMYIITVTNATSKGIVKFSK